MIYSALARLIPTSSVVGLVTFLSSFSAKLLAAEKQQIAVANRHDDAIAKLTAQRDDALANASTARSLADALGRITENS